MIHVGYGEVERRSPSSPLYLLYDNFEIQLQFVCVVTMFDCLNSPSLTQLWKKFSSLHNQALKFVQSAICFFKPLH